MQIIMKLRSVFTLVILFLMGCSSTPKILQGDFSTLTPSQVKSSHLMNKQVRWSGYITQTIHKKDKTCFEIIETESYDSTRPKKILAKEGSRFLACKEGFLEPQAFNKRGVTITGTLVAYTHQKIGEYDYEYPVIKTDIIYIWRKQPPVNYYHFNTFGTFSHFHCGHSFISGYCY
jgi:outer membrane lipoprotein